jgi:hypothetical protein
VERWSSPDGWDFEPGIHVFALDSIVTPALVGHHALVPRQNLERLKP